jgi:rubrerythrin
MEKQLIEPEITNSFVPSSPEKILNHPQLVRLLKKAYSAEKAAAYAYQGHAGSVRNPLEKTAIRQIEEDEWNHRHEVFSIMKHYGIEPSKWYEIRYAIIGKVISASCYVIGWFMPFFFAGKLESGNVCEYFKAKQYFNALGIREFDQALYDMGIKEKEHEVYFLNKIKNSRVLPYFEKLFSWGRNKSANNVDLDKKYPVEESDVYCNK